MSVKLPFSGQIFEKYSNIKFRGNPSSGSLVVYCGQTGVRRNDGTNSRSFALLRTSLKTVGSSNGLCTCFKDFAVFVKLSYRRRENSKRSAVCCEYESTELPAPTDCQIRCIADEWGMHTHFWSSLCHSAEWQVLRKTSQTLARSDDCTKTTDRWQLSAAFRLLIIDRISFTQQDNYPALQHLPVNISATVVPTWTKFSGLKAPSFYHFSHSSTNNNQIFRS